MVERLNYRRDLERDIRMYTLTNRLLDSLGYSPSNRLRPEDFDGFVEKAKEEEKVTYSALENIVCGIEQNEEPRSLGRKIAYKAFDFITLPIEKLISLRDMVQSKTGSRSTAFTVFLLSYMALPTIVAYFGIKYNKPKTAVLIVGLLLMYSSAYMISRRSELRNSLDPEGIRLLEKRMEIYGEILNKVNPDYKFMHQLEDHFKAKR